MAYYGYEFYYDGTRATFWGYIQAALVNMGWELHDNISSTVKVYKSAGESGNEPYGYIWIDAGTSTYIEFCAYQYWDNSTHTGVRPRYPYDNIAYARIGQFSSTCPALMAGDKDTVFLSSNLYTGSVVSMIFGHVSNRVGVLVGAHGTAGTAGTLTVATTSGLGVGQHLQIVSSDGYVETVHVASILDSSTITVNRLSTNYGTGSKIGAPASTFGVVNGPVYKDYWCQVSVWGDNGTTASTSDFNFVSFTPTFYNVLFFDEVKYVPEPFYIVNPAASYPGVVLGTLNINFLRLQPATNEDVAVANNDGSISTAGTGSFGTAASAGDATLIDSSKSWGADELIGKFCVITGGSGTSAGGVKKITGNDATSFTADSNWYIKPVSGAIYILADSVSRGKNNMLSAYFHGLLTNTAPPT